MAEPASSRQGNTATINIASPRGKSINQLEAQRDRIFFEALGRDQYGRMNRAEEIGNRYIANIRATDRFQQAQRDFDRMGYDLAFRRQLEAQGRRPYDEMYNSPYSASEYMRRRRSNRE